MTFTLFVVPCLSVIWGNNSASYLLLCQCSYCVKMFFCYLNETLTELLCYDYYNNFLFYFFIVYFTMISKWRCCMVLVINLHKSIIWEIFDFLMRCNNWVNWGCGVCILNKKHKGYIWHKWWPITILLFYTVCSSRAALAQIMLLFYPQCLPGVHEAGRPVNGLSPEYSSPLSSQLVKLGPGH